MASSSLCFFSFGAIVVALCLALVAQPLVADRSDASGRKEGASQGKVDAANEKAAVIVESVIGDVFNLMDADASESISHDEFLNGYRRMKGDHQRSANLDAESQTDSNNDKPASSETQMPEVNSGSKFSLHDLDADGGISPSEWVQILSPSKSKRQRHHTFLDGLVMPGSFAQTGEGSTHTAAAALASAGTSDPLGSMAEDLFTIMDVDGSNDLSWDEFETGYKRIKREGEPNTLSTQAQSSEDKASNLLRLMGLPVVNQHKEGATNVGDATLSPLQIVDLDGKGSRFSDVDTNSDGSISPEEFAKLFELKGPHIES